MYNKALCPFKYAVPPPLPSNVSSQFKAALDDISFYWPHKFICWIFTFFYDAYSDISRASLSLKSLTYFTLVYYLLHHYTSLFIFLFIIAQARENMWATISKQICQINSTSPHLGPRHYSFLRRSSQFVKHTV